MPTLVMLSPAPVIELPDDEVVLDSRFVEGMNLHCQLWPGPVICVMRRGAQSIADGARFAVGRLGFDLVLTDRDHDVPLSLLDSATLVYCAADDMRYLDLARAMRGRIGRLVYSVEQSLAERLATARDSRWSLRRQYGAVVWNLRREGRLRAALRSADGVHLNGRAAAASYGRQNRETLVYLDNRIRQTMLARSAVQAERARRLTAGGPLRLVATGHLEPDSGIEDLLPVAFLLRNLGVDFHLDIMGRGPLADRFRRGIAAMGLNGHVTLSDPDAPEGHLFAHLRQSCDLALMPRRGPEGPGPYIEAMGCGLPVIGYASSSWRLMARESGAGWVTTAWPGAMVQQIIALDRQRDALVAASERAVAYAAETTFEKVFARRMSHLRRLAGLD